MTSRPCSFLFFQDFILCSQKVLVGCVNEISVLYPLDCLVEVFCGAGLECTITDDVVPGSIPSIDTKSFASASATLSLDIN